MKIKIGRIRLGLVIISVSIFGVLFFTKQNWNVTARHQIGEYESLNEAFKATVKINEKPEADENASFAQSAKLFAADGASNDRFGVNVAIDGNTAIVGVFLDDVGATDQGSAYVFVKNGATWIFQAKLTADDGLANDHFGGAVAISGDTAIVGALRDDVGANFNQGSAYVFTRNGTTWTQQQKLTANDGAANENFGSYISIADETAIIGAFSDDVGANTDQGSAYVFVRSGGNWTQQQKLVADDGAGGDSLGLSIAISGTTAIIGAFGDDINTNASQGSAYIFVKNGATWTQQAKLTADDGASDDEFGTSAAISGDTVIVSALGDDFGGNSAQGSAYIFTRNGTTWTQQQKLVANDGTDLDNFGLGVAISENTAFVGSWLDDIGTSSDQGSVYIFTRNGAVWTQQEKLLANDGATTDYFGNSVAISGDTLIVGAYGDNFGSSSDQGSAYIFENTTYPVPFDFDGDGKTDISIFRPSVGEWWYLKSSDGGNAAAQFGAGTDKLTPGDFTGDGKTDIAFWRPSSGFWFVLRSEDFSYYSFPFGTNGDIPAVGDFDADGKADATIFRPSNATWYISKSSGGTLIQQFGQNGDVPTPADYDGDGTADIAIYRVALGEWWIQRSTAGLIAFQFGNSTDKPVPGDFTGDGKADVGLFRPSTGEWFVLRSEDQSYYSFPFGTNGDVPAPGDYDGDGKFDASVFRPSNNTWYIQRTTAGTLIQSFGQSGDLPVPNAFVP